MSILENQVRIMEMLAANEEAVSRLYRVYADKFAEHKNFWAGLSMEELDHARWIREMQARIKDGFGYFDEKRISMDSIKLSIDNINGQTAKAQAQTMMATEAFFIANDIENAMIESNWFQACKGDSLEFKRLVFDLDQATTRHREELSKFLNRGQKGVC
jgi:hypothetical protein